MCDYVIKIMTKKYFEIMNQWCNDKRIMGEILRKNWQKILKQINSYLHPHGLSTLADQHG